jgi:chemotaxis protein methyltransferase WspC
MKSIEEFLREKIGLDCKAAGPTMIQRTIRRRMKALGLLRVEEYRQRLLSSAGEFEELLETVVVKETWFFRDADVFSSLARLAIEQWLPRNRGGKMRLLSLPCSSGEEAFSIVMALLDAGMPADQFDVDAVDISNRALMCARRGVYMKNAFRGKDLDFRDRHFRQNGEAFSLGSSIQRKVHFVRGNLLGADFAAPHSQYDIVFFRNLLIYLDSEAQNLALHRIDPLLSPGGMLFVGSAEQPLVLDRGFASAGLPLAFACVKRQSRQFRAAHANFEVECRKPEESNRSLFGNNAGRASCADLNQARSLADAGRLTEAAAICEAHLRESRFSAQAYYLLGLVRDARGDPKAVECYRKALYLEPNHYDSLVQLAVLAEQKGDLESARNFQRRARRHRGDNQFES